MNTDHPTDERLQMLLDGAEVDRAVRDHLRTCARCSAVFDSLRRVDATLARRPVERVGSDFTRSVMAKLGIVPKTPWLFRFVENLAYLFGLMIVLGVMLAAFIFSGVISMERVLETPSTVGSITGAIGGALHMYGSSLAQALQRYLPFVFGRGSLQVVIMVMLALGMLAVVDKLVKRRMLR